MLHFSNFGHTSRCCNSEARVPLSVYYDQLWTYTQAITLSLPVANHCNEGGETRGGAGKHVTQINHTLMTRSRSHCTYSQAAYITLELLSKARQGTKDTLASLWQEKLFAVLHRASNVHRSPCSGNLPSLKVSLGSIRLPRAAWSAHNSQVGLQVSVAYLTSSCRLDCYYSPSAGQLRLHHCIPHGRVHEPPGFLCHWQIHAHSTPTVTYIHTFLQNGIQLFTHIYTGLQ